MQSGGLSSQIIKVCTHDLFLLLKATVVRNEITRTVREDRAVLPSHWLPFLCFSNPFQKPREVNHASVVTIHNLVNGAKQLFLYSSVFSQSWCDLPVLSQFPNDASQEYALFLWKPPDLVMCVQLELGHALFSIQLNEKDWVSVYLLRGLLRWR